MTHEDARSAIWAELDTHGLSGLVRREMDEVAEQARRELRVPYGEARAQEIADLYRDQVPRFVLSGVLIAEATRLGATAELSKLSRQANRAREGLRAVGEGEDPKRRERLQRIGERVGGWIDVDARLQAH